MIQGKMQKGKEVSEESSRGQSYGAKWGEAASRHAVVLVSRNCLPSFPVPPFLTLLSSLQGSLLSSCLLQVPILVAAFLCRQGSGKVKGQEWAQDLGTDPVPDTAVTAGLASSPLLFKVQCGLCQGLNQRFSSSTCVHENQ